MVISSPVHVPAPLSGEIFSMITKQEVLGVTGAVWMLRTKQKVSPCSESVA